MMKNSLYTGVGNTYSHNQGNKSAGLVFIGKEDGSEMRRPIIERNSSFLNVLITSETPYHKGDRSSTLMLHLVDADISNCQFREISTQNSSAISILYSTALLKATKIHCEAPNSFNNPFNYAFKTLPMNFPFST